MKKQNKHSIAITLLTTALLGIGAMPASAEPIFSGYISDQSAGDHFTLTVNAYPSPQEIDANNFLVGLTYGVLTEYNPSNTVIATSDPFLMFCSDFLHDINQGDTYNVTIESLVTPSGQDPATYIPDSAGLNLTLKTLQIQALLGAKFDGTTPNDSNVQHEIWNLSGANPAIDGPDPSVMAALYANAQAAQPGANYSGAFLLDPQGDGGQAFMSIDPTSFDHNLQSPTPEPGTLAMLGLGLIGLGSIKLRKTRR